MTQRLASGRSARRIGKGSPSLPATSIQFTRRGLASFWQESGIPAQAAI